MKILKTEDIASIHFAAKIEETKATKQNYIMTHENNILIRGGYFNRQTEAEARLARAKDAPWYNFKAKFDGIVAKSDAATCAELVSELDCVLDQHQSEYDNAVSDLKKLADTKTKYIDPSNRLSEETRDHRFNILVSNTTEVKNIIDEQTRRSEAVETAALNLRNNVWFVNESNLNIRNKYISDSSNFAKDVAIAKNDEWNQNEQQKYNIPLRDYYEAKRSDQSTFLGRLLHGYYEKKHVEYSEKCIKNDNYRNLHSEEIAAAHTRITEFRKWAGFNDFKLADKMIEKQEKVKIEHGADGQPIFRRSDIFESKVEIMNEIIRKSGAHANELKPVAERELASAEARLRNMDSEVKAYLFQANTLNQRQQNAYDSLDQASNTTPIQAAIQSPENQAPRNFVQPVQSQTSAFYLNMFRSE